MNTLTYANDDYIFNAWHENTQNDFKHVGILKSKDSPYYADVTTYYYNRTYEFFSYETVLIKALKEIKKSIKEECLHMFKLDNNYKRLTAKRLKEFEQSNYYKPIKKECKKLNKFLHEIAHEFLGKQSYNDHYKNLNYKTI